MMSQLNFSSSTMRILPGEFYESSSCYCEIYIVIIVWRLGHVPWIDKFGFTSNDELLLALLLDLLVLFELLLAGCSFSAL